MELLIGSALAAIALFGLLTRGLGPRPPVRRLRPRTRRGTVRHGFDPRRLGIDPLQPPQARQALRFSVGAAATMLAARRDALAVVRLADQGSSARAPGAEAAQALLGGGVPAAGPASQTGRAERGKTRSP